jgi:hypothetical protein
VKRTLLVGALSVLIVIATQAPAFAASGFHDVTAATEGPDLLVTFRETGLQPGQNYAYIAAGTYTETFVCYRDRTFTPTHKSATISGAAGQDPRVYTANDRGVVRGFVSLWPYGPWPRFCPAHQSEVPVSVCYQPTDLVDFADPFDVYWFPDGTSVCGPIEPD